MERSTTRYRSKKHSIRVQYLIDGGKRKVTRPTDDDTVSFRNIDLSRCKIEPVNEDVSYDYLMGFRDGVLQCTKYYEQLNK